MEPVWRPEYLDLTVEQLEAAYGQTAALFEAMYGESRAYPTRMHA